MKKILSIAIVAIMIVALSVSALAVEDYTDVVKATWTNTVHVSYDEIRKGDDSGLVVCGGDPAKISDVTLGTGLTDLIFWGWTSASAEITGFGYSVNGGEIVKDDSFKFETEPAVVAAGPGDFDSRMKIKVPVSEGTQMIRLFVCFGEDAEVIWQSKMTIGEATDFTDNYATDEPDTPPTADAAVVVIATVAVIALAGVVVVKKARA